MKETRQEAIQCIDYFLGQEIASGRVKEYGYAARVAKEVHAHGHTITIGDVYSRKRAIFTKGKVLSPASFFQGKPTSRLGKDKNYHFQFMLLQQWLERNQIRYIGLPANQLDVIASQMDFGGLGQLIACEMNPQTYNHMRGLRRFIYQQRKKPARPSISIYKKNVFDVMEMCADREDERKFNWVDLDLMVQLPSEPELYRWAELIHDCTTSRTPIILHVAAYTARATTTEEHLEAVSDLCDVLDEVGFETVGKPTHYIYADSAMPMGCLCVVLQHRDRRKR